MDGRPHEIEYLPILHVSKAVIAKMTAVDRATLSRVIRSAGWCNGASPGTLGGRAAARGVPKDRRIGMIRWLLCAVVAFLVIATLQSFMARRRENKQVEGQDNLPKLPSPPDAAELEKSRRELEELEQRLNIHNTGQQGKGA